jgi:hypothetical protein
MGAGLLLRTSAHPLLFPVCRPCHLVNPARGRRLRHKRPPAPRGPLHLILGAADGVLPFGPARHPPADVEDWGDSCETGGG